MSSTLQRKFVEQRIQKSRAEESRNAELRQMLVQHNILAGHGRSENHVEELRRKRTEAGERRDLFMDYTYVKAAQDQECRDIVVEAEERVADELARRKAEEERLEQERRRICAGSEELRILKERLHAAKVNKERAQQLLEIEVRNEKQRRVDHIVAEHMENERLEKIEMEHKVEIGKMKEREHVRHINQQQIATKEAQREEAKKEYLKEKAQVEALVQQIQDEDDAEAAAKEQKRIESREMLLRFKIEQAERQEAQEQAEIEENNKIAKFAADKVAREEQLAHDKAEAEKEKERLQLGIIGVMMAKNKEAEELEHLRNELHAEEHEHKAREKEERKKQKIIQDREDMKAAHAMQMEIKQKKLAELQAEENAIRDIVLKKFAENERIEQMNDQKRRLRIEAHKREAQRLIDVRREAFERDKEEERAEDRRKRDEEAHHHMVIEEERRKLIKDHGIPLRDFLPKGTLQTKDDYDMIFRESLLDPYATKRPGNLTAR